MGVECFKADLHIHTCLSPCGHLEMSPRKIVESALERGLDIIAITDHNDPQRASLREIGDELGLYVVAGCEVNTQEGGPLSLFSPISTWRLSRNTWMQRSRILPMILYSLDIRWL